MFLHLSPMKQMLTVPYKVVTFNYFLLLHTNERLGFAISATRNRPAQYSVYIDFISVYLPLIYQEAEHFTSTVFHIDARKKKTFLIILKLDMTDCRCSVKELSCS